MAGLLPKRAAVRTRTRVAGAGVGALAILVIALAAAGVTVAAGNSGNGSEHLSGELDGFQGVPSISSRAQGEIKVKLNGSSIRYELEYSGFTAQNKVQVAHIHFAQEGVNGGVAAFLCGGNGTPPCPETSGRVTGTITAANVEAITDQGLAAGDIGALISAIKAGYTYANVHSMTFASGEIRGQIGGDDGDHHSDGGRKHNGDHDEDGD